MEHKVQLFYKVNEKNIHGYEAYENISRDEKATVESDMMKIITPVRSDECLSFTGNMEEDIRKIGHMNYTVRTYLEMWMTGLNMN